MWEGMLQGMWIGISTTMIPINTGIASKVRRVMKPSIDES